MARTGFILTTVSLLAAAPAAYGKLHFFSRGTLPYLSGTATKFEPPQSSGKQIGVDVSDGAHSIPRVDPQSVPKNVPQGRDYENTGKTGEGTDGQEQEYQGTQRDEEGPRDRLHERRERQFREREQEKWKREREQEREQKQETEEEREKKRRNGEPTGSAPRSRIPRLALADGATASDAVPQYVTSSASVRRQYWVLAASTISTPTGYGAEWEDVFAGVGFQDRARLDRLVTGTGLLGFGVGRSEKNVGLEVGIASYGLIRHGLPYHTGGINFKLHRFIPYGEFAVALGWDNAIWWGNSDNGNSLYFVASRHFFLKEDRLAPFSLMFVHLGVGDGRFRGWSDALAGRNAVNVFWSAGVRVVNSLNLIANWDGADLAAGVSFAPYRNFPFIVNLSLLDIAGRAGDGPRFSVVFAYGDSVKNPRFPVDWFRK